MCDTTCFSHSILLGLRGEVLTGFALASSPNLNSSPFLSSATSPLSASSRSPCHSPLVLRVSFLLWRQDDTLPDESSARPGKTQA